jgi:hypothetical protein
VDKGSIVPNVFFDLIARVVPGAAVMLAIYLTTGHRVAWYLIEVFVPMSSRGQSFPWLIVVLGSAYLFGHLLSPVVEFLKPLAPREDSETYNRLRYRNPSAAVLATRIRSEATMYGGLAGVVLVGYFLEIFFSPRPSGFFRFLTTTCLAAMAFWLLCWRYKSVQTRFVKTLEGLWGEAQSQLRQTS